MGSIVTVNKHHTNLDEWLLIQDKLDDISFNSEINNHLSVWKVTNEDNTQNYNINPLHLDLSASHSLISSE